MNVTLRILNFFVLRFYSSHKNLPDDWTDSCTVFFSIRFSIQYFFKNGILKNVKKIEKIHIDS